MNNRLDRYADYSDAEIYKVLCEVYPALVAQFDRLAEMQAVRGFSDEELLNAFRSTWDKDDLEVWDEDDQFRGRLMLRGIHHIADQIRKRRPYAETN
jgi:hypothetical protein